MRSKIGIKSRLAAHILALILLIIMLVDLAPSQSRRSATAIPAVATAVQPIAAPQAAVPVEHPAVVASAPAEPHVDNMTIAGGDGETVPAAPTKPTVLAEQTQPTLSADDSAEPETPSAKTTALETSAAPISTLSPPVEDTTLADKVDGDAAKPEPKDQPIPHEEEPIAAVSTPVEPETAAAESPTAETTPSPASETPVAAEPEPTASEAEQPAPIQPDESGSIVIATSDAGSSQQAATQLLNANLEVLGDGVYWLGPQHDLQKELASIPGLSDVIILAPLPGYKVPGFEHVIRDIIPADTADLSADAAERFLHFTKDRSMSPVYENGPRPVVVIAAIHGARGAAFFKGVYLLYNRNLSFDEIEKRIEPELDEAGSDRDEIIHRLRHLSGR